MVDELSRISVWFGVGVELLALACIPLVLLRRREPASTAAWILALVFLPGVGATLFLLFGRDRVRLPVARKQASDQALARRIQRVHGRPSELLLRHPRGHLPTTVDRELFRIGAALSSVDPTTGNEARVLIDGDATYAAIGDAIDGATSHVYAEYYLISAGITADWFRDRLMAAARRGVRVKLLLDGFGCFWLQRSWVRTLRTAGVEVAFFLPARLILFQPMSLRNHRKIVVVDGDVGFTGGLNVGDEYRGLRGPWRDTHLMVRGPAAQALARVFEQDWYFATSREVTDSVLQPSSGREVDSSNRGASRTSPKGLEESGRREFRARARARLYPAAARASSSSHRRDATVAIVRSGPDILGTERETIHRLFFSAITLAQTYVHITTPYFIPDRAIVVALQTAALRGVDVQLLFPGRSNHPSVFHAGRSFYEELLDAGVRIFEYGPGMIHAKTMVVDGAISLVGSANMDIRSFRLNFEVHAMVRDEHTANDLEACFRKDLSVSRPIDLALWRTRPSSIRVVQGLARLLSPLM